MSYLKTLDQQYKIENPASNQSTTKTLKHSQDVKLKNQQFQGFSKMFPLKKIPGSQADH